MKLLFIGLNYAPEPVGIGPYTAGLAQALAQAGHEVEVIAGKPYYPQWRPYPDQPDGIVRSMEAGVGITRVPHYIPREPTGARRIVHHLSFAASAWRPAMAAARRGADLVLAIAPSLLSVPVARRAARLAGCPLWLHVQDFEVEAAFATGLVGGRSVLGKAALKLEAAVLGTADIASSISPSMCAKLAEKGVPADRIVELRNWSNAMIDPDRAQPVRYRSEWGTTERKVALYSGNIANKQGLEIVIEAARLLRERADIAFVICGEGPNRARLEALACDCPNVQFHDLQPAGRMGDFLTFADVHLLPQIVGAADLVLPSKLTNMLASGKPVVATAAPGTGLYQEVEGCGINTPPGDAGALAQAVARLVDDPALAARLGDEGRRRARERWSLGAALATVERQLARLQPRVRSS